MKTLFVIAVGSLINLDNVSAFQFLISRPSFAATILGYMVGFPLEGFLIGLLLELVILDFSPIGGTTIPNGTAAAVVSVLLLGRINPYLCFIVGLFAGELYSYIEKHLRIFRNLFNRLVEKQIIRYDFNFGKLVILSMLCDFIAFALYSYSVYLVFVSFSGLLNSNYLLNVSRVATLGILFVTLTSLYFKFKNQVRKNA
ncbi:MAG: PTS sugar transporter subunit IIC [Elusimicrobiales bacterium]|nr:PTS sugar transporter subunit IIC [Elusimicrobiales bacterium]